MLLAAVAIARTLTVAIMEEGFMRAKYLLGFRVCGLRGFRSLLVLVVWDWVRVLGVQEWLRKSRHSHRLAKKT